MLQLAVFEKWGLMVSSVLTILSDCVTCPIALAGSLNFPALQGHWPKTPLALEEISFWVISKLLNIWFSRVGFFAPSEDLIVFEILSEVYTCYI